MTILHYIPSLEKESGGVGAYMQILARDLGKLCELHILTHKGKDELQLNNCIIHYIPNSIWSIYTFKTNFLELLNQLKPDVFHVNSCWTPTSSLTAIWAKNVGYPVVYTPHGMLEPYSLKRHYWSKKLPATLLYQHKGLAVADFVHATAETERSNLIKLGWNKNVVVIPNCVQIDLISMKTSWARKKNILFLSRVHPKKGVNFLIEAVAELKNDFSDYSITIAGPGEESYICSLRNLAEKKGVAKMFDFIGPVFGEEKWALYKKADLLVLPTYSENFGIVVPEALASGTPVITTNGAPWEELNTNHCGWCIEIGTAPLVQAFKEFLNCPEKELRSMGEKGRELVLKKYSSISIANQFMDMYNSIHSVS